MKIKLIQPLTDKMRHRRRAWLGRAAGLLSRKLLKIQNRLFAGTLGVSKNNRHLGFLPAYQDSGSGVVCLSRFANGSPAPVHVLDGLPGDWVLERDAAGHVVRARAGVIAGFLRDDRFYTREEAVGSVR